MKHPLLRAVPTLCGLAALFTSSAEAKLLGYWNFDGPPGTSTADRLKDKSGNNYHGHDRNYGGGTGVNRVLFNAVDAPRAPYLPTPGTTNYCLDLTGNNTAGVTENNRYVVIEPAPTDDGSGISVASGAVDSAGNAFNLGNTTGTSVSVTNSKMTVAFWYKGNTAQAWANYVSKGGEAYATAGKAFEGWAVRKNNTNARFAWTLRGSFGGSGDLDGGADYNNRSGGTLAAASLNAVLFAAGNVANNITGNLSDNGAVGTWQHAAMVWDGTKKHMYINGFHNKSEATASATYIGTTARLAFGIDLTPADVATLTRASRVRLDEICIWDEALTPGQVEDLARGASPLLPLRNSWRPFDFAMPAANPNLVPYNSAYPPAYAANPAGPNAIYPASTGGLPGNALDGNLATAYINLKGVYSGLMTTLPASSIVKSFTITTAADAPDKDPATYEIWGTTSALASADNSGGRAEAWTLLQSGALNLPAGRGVVTVFPVTNSTTYLNYKLVFPTLKGATEKSMQLAEVQYFTSTDGTGAGLLLPASVARAIAEPTISNGQSWCQAAEQVVKVIDGATGTKYLNTAGAGSGFIVTPAAASVVKSFKATTANDGQARDATTYAIYGTTDAITSVNNSDGKGGENWTLIQTGRLTLPFARTTVGPTITLTNSTSYTSYKVLFPTNGGDVLFQLAEFQLYTTTDGTGTGVLAPANPILAIADGYMGPLSVASYYAGYTGGPIMPQGGPGYMGVYEQRANGNLRRPDGSSSGNANVYTGDSPILYARWGSSNAPSYTPGIQNYPLVRATTTSINFGDDNSILGSGYDGAQNEFLTSTIPAAQDNMVQLIQGCFRVTTPGKYTFTMRGDDGCDLSIQGATWVTLYRDNGFGAILGDTMQCHMTTGDSNVVAVVNFPTAGDYNFRYSYSEATGGAYNEVFYAQGENTRWTGATDFKHLGDPSGGLTLVDHAPFVEIYSTAYVVNGGVPANVTLTWDSPYCTQVTLNGGIFTNTNVTNGITAPVFSNGTVNFNGSVTIPAPSVTTNYTITGVRNGGTPVTKTITVLVNSAPQMNTFTVDDDTLAANAPATFRWTAVGIPTSISISNGVTNYTVPVANYSVTSNGLVTGSITTGALIPNPSVTTTYAITATNGIGTSPALTAVVTIGVGPVVTITSDKSTNIIGSPVRIDWAASVDALSQTISPRIITANATLNVPRTGFSIESPVRTTTYTITATNAFASASASVTVTMPERIGTDSSGWTIEANYWNRFGYTDPALGVISTLQSGILQVEQMLAIPDSALGERGPAATVNFNSTNPAISGPAVPPNVQPGTGEKMLMRYRQTGMASCNIDDAATTGGNLTAVASRPPPALTTGVTYDFFSCKCTAKIKVNVPGNYIFGINNDDGGRLRMDLNGDHDFTDSGELLISDDTYHGYLNGYVFTSSLYLLQGTYDVEYIFFDNSGGGGGEMWFVDINDPSRALPLSPIPDAAPAPTSTGLVISEFMTNNSSGLNDSEGSSPDWIELYNGTAAPISLDGYFLTDRTTNLGRWAFPTGLSIPAGKYQVVFASGKADRIPPVSSTTELHTNFTLGSGANYVALTQSNGAGGYNVISSYNYPAQRQDISYGWYNGTAVGFNTRPSPGSANQGGYASIVAGDTHFNVDRGIMAAPFTLMITQDDLTPGTTIRYTTDGSKPTLLNGTDFPPAGLPISATTCVRAAAFRLGALPTNVDTQTYIFPASVLAQNTLDAVSKGFPLGIIATQYFDYGMDPYIVQGHEEEIKTALKSIPTVSLVTDIANFMDPVTGIFVESQFRGAAYERGCSVELINDTGTVADVGGNLKGNFQLDAGVRSRGGFSRSDTNPKHSWHLYFRSDYEGKLKYPIYGADGADVFSQMDLATANNYSWSYAPEAANIRTFSYTNSAATTSVFTWRYNTFIRDVAGRDAQINMSGFGTHNKYVHLYLNGQYWGLHMLQERAESSYAESYLGGDKNNYDVVKSAGSPNSYQTESTDGDGSGAFLAPITYQTISGAATGTTSSDSVAASAWAKLYAGAYDLRLRNDVKTAQINEDDRNIRLYKLMGMDYNPTTKTATPNAAYPVLLDVNNLAEYMLITFYCGAFDAPMSTFLGGANTNIPGSNNWFAIRDRTGKTGFKYLVWDFEHGMGSDMLSGDIGVATAATDIDYSANTDARFVWTVNNAFPGSYRSTNRLGPWGLGGIPGTTTTTPSILAVRNVWPANQQYRGLPSATNPEFWQSPYMYNYYAAAPQNGPNSAPTQLYRSNPQYLHENLCFASEYRRMFADRAQQMLRQNGPLTTPKVLATITSRATQLDPAIIAESARWGNAQGVTVVNYDKNAWLSAVQNLKDWVTHGDNQRVLNSLPIYSGGTPLAGTGVAGPGRAEVLITQLKTYRDGSLLSNVGTAGPFWFINGLFPGLDAPVLANWGGVVTSGTNVAATNPTTNPTGLSIYYTTNGTDPRPLGGGAPVGPALSIASGGNITLTATGKIIARVYNPGATGESQWSPAATADFVVGVPASRANLAITEINYNPKSTAPALGTPDAGDVQTFEFIELANISAGPVDLTGVNFSTGITYTFPVGRVLAPGERIVVAKNPGALATRYPDGTYPGLSGKTVGPYAGNLSNGGENIVLRALDTTEIRNFIYADSDVWPRSADGETGAGRSIFLANYGTLTADAALNDGTNWSPHGTIGGNPGGPDATNFAAWANERALNPNLPNGDAEDTDGADALLEYALGSDPSKWTGKEYPGSGTATFIVSGIPDKYLTFSYSRNQNAPDVVYAVQTSSDLATLSWTTAGATWVSTTPNNDGTETVVYRANVPLNDMITQRLFMKVLVTIP